MHNFENPEEGIKFKNSVVAYFHYSGDRIKFDIRTQLRAGPEAEAFLIFERQRD